MADPQSPGLVVATDHAELINNYRYSVIVQPGAVVKEGRAFAASLIQIVSDVDQANAFLQAADFDGNKLIDVLMREEIALVTQEYTQFIGTPFQGALSLEAFKTKYKAFKEVLSSQPSEKDPAEVIGILKLWMRSDTDIRQQYQILCMQQDCKVDLKAHLKQMRKLLRSVKTTAQVDALQAGRSNTTLVVKTIEEVPAPDSIALLSAVKSAMSMTKGKKRSKAVLDALIAHGVDPVKGMKGKEKDKKKGNGNVEIPRNPDGSVSKWVVGMALCKCKGEGSPTGADDGGKHLYKHCKKADTSPPDRQVANVVEIKTGMSDDEWNSAFSGFFDHISNPCVLLDPSNNSEIAIDASIVSMAGEYISDDNTSRPWPSTSASTVHTPPPSMPRQLRLTSRRPRPSPSWTPHTLISRGACIPLLPPTYRRHAVTTMGRGASARRLHHRRRSATVSPPPSQFQSRPRPLPPSSPRVPTLMP